MSNAVDTPLARRERSLTTSRRLAWGILVLAAVAATWGLLDRERSFGPATPGSSFTSLWSEAVDLEGQGLYRRDSVSGAAQERAQDLVTLVLGLPLLGGALAWSRKGSPAARLLLGGALGYFLYCYAMMAVGTAYNEAFLLYVALFAAALPAFVLALASVDLDALAEAARDGAYPRRGAAVLLLLVAAFLGLNWLGGVILPSLRGGEVPKGLDAYSTLFVQAMDLGILVPAGLLGGFWLLRRDARGYLLGTVLLVKGTAEGLAVAAMGFNMLRSGVAESLGLILGFLALALANLGTASFALSRIARGASGKGTAVA